MISYAQNLEDVVLNRIFCDKSTGFYIDVGAHDPTALSVTRHFYDRGWCGINIEPIPESHANFQRERQRDVNLNCAAGKNPGKLTIYEIEAYPALSTFNKDIAESGARIADSALRERIVEVMTLADICFKHCRDHEIDFIKIDVEGHEKAVIQGADWERFRPLMLVVEACKPLKPLVPAWEEWEPMVLGTGYLFVYYDGLNRFYLRQEDESLKSAFEMPITPVLDHYSFYRDIRNARKSADWAEIVAPLK